MKISLKRTPEQIELIKAMASKNRSVAYEAQVALAEFIGPVISEVINNAPVLSNLFAPLQFNSEDNPSIPLDLYYDVSDEDYVQVFSNTVAGGLPQNQVVPTVSELKIATYSLDTAVSFDRRYAAKSRMDVVSKTFTRMAQEILLKQERTSANLLMGALAGASTNGKDHVFRATTDGSFLLDDFNELITRAKRINTSWSKGTPEGGRRGITDILVSPEAVKALREMAYNPINTKTVGTGNDLAAPESLRNDVYQAGGGLPSFYGISLMEVNELGVGQKFNTIFDTVAGSSTYAKADGTTGDAEFDGAADEILVGLDRGREALVKAIAVDEENGSEFQLTADDQYSIRQNKIGWFGGLEEGRMVLDNRALLGIIAKSL
tara:strand:+ start:2254 stop:3384 length:1131 start_codon:yes stop_codon:yes gene_type:complete